MCGYTWLHVEYELLSKCRDRKRSAPGQNDHFLTIKIDPTSYNGFYSHLQNQIIAYQLINLATPFN